jgi:hypothetical protein
MTKRFSSPECTGSGTVIESGSKKTVAASANATPCFSRLDSALSGSHSNPVFMPRIYAMRLRKKTAEKNNFPLLFAIHRPAEFSKNAKGQGRRVKGTGRREKRFYATAFTYRITGAAIVFRLGARRRFAITVASCRPTSALTLLSALRTDAGENGFNYLELL